MTVVQLPVARLLPEAKYEDSFDEELLAFKNKLGYYSQWFTKVQLLELLHSDQKPIPIEISLNDETRTFGHVFSNRSL